MSAIKEIIDNRRANAGFDSFQHLDLLRALDILTDQVGRLTDELHQRSAEAQEIADSIKDYWKHLNSHAER